MTEDQRVKLLLLAMAEVLQVNLDEKRLVLYANALADIGSAGLEVAMAQLLADPEIRPGHMLMPGKIRELAGGRVADRAQSIVTEILVACRDESNRFLWKARLSPMAWDIAQTYGLKAIEECGPSGKGTLIAQLRDMARTAVAAEHRAIATSAAISYGGGRSLAISEMLKLGDDNNG